MPDTHANKNVADVYAGGKTKKKWATVAEAIGPSDTMRLANDGKIYAVKTADGPASGVMALKNGHDIASDYSVGDWAPYYKKGQDTDVWVWMELHSALAPVKDGDIMIVSATDDQVALFVYTNAAIATDTIYLKVGTMVGHDPGHLTEASLVKINLS